jgi:uncharacterized Zn-finger protein
MVRYGYNSNHCYICVYGRSSKNGGLDVWNLLRHPCNNDDMPLNESNKFDYRLNRDPKCPYCDHDIDMTYADLHHLYSEDEKNEVECPMCDEVFYVRANVTWSFDSSKEKEDDE